MSDPSAVTSAKTGAATGAATGHAVPAVVLRDGDEASGMAMMIAGLIEDNLRDFRGRARIAGRSRGSVVLTASDRDVSITVSFGRDGIVITDGAEPGAAVMAGPWLTMSRVCSGRITPWRAMRDRELTVGWGRSMQIVPAAGFVLSVPASFYGDEMAQRRRRIVVAVVASLVIAGAVGVIVGGLMRAER